MFSKKIVTLTIVLLGLSLMVTGCVNQWFERPWGHSDNTLSFNVVGASKTLGPSKPHVIPRKVWAKVWAERKGEERLKELRDEWNKIWGSKLGKWDDREDIPDSPEFPYQDKHKQITHVVIHHTVHPNNTGWEWEDWAEVVGDIWAHHALRQGWADIGYHYLIDPNGNIYEGRADPQGEREDYLLIGAHAAPYNVGTVGIAFLGSFMNEKEWEDEAEAGRRWKPKDKFIGKPTENAINAAIGLIAWIFYQNDITDPFEESVISHSKDKRKYSRIIGHRDVVKKVCPGYYLYEKLDDIRQAVADTLTPSSASTVFRQGWNLFSVPLQPIVPDPQVVLGDDLERITTWHWNPEKEAWDKNPDIVPGHAYWIWVNKDTIVNAQGSPITLSYYYIQLKKGWNMIGQPYNFPVKLVGLQVLKGANKASLQEAVQLEWIYRWVWYWTHEGWYAFDVNSRLIFFWSLQTKEWRYIPEIDVDIITLNPWAGLWVWAYDEISLEIPSIPAHAIPLWRTIEQGSQEEEILTFAALSPPSSPPFPNEPPMPPNLINKIESRR